jgi:hypothetical protein
VDEAAEPRIEVQMEARKNGRPISDRLRRVIEGCGLTRYEISKLTRIDNAVLCRFVDGKRGRSLDSIDRLGRGCGWQARQARPAGLEPATCGLEV